MSSKHLKDLMASVREVDPFADYLNESPIANIDKKEYLDSTVYILNYILSGDIFMGMSPRVLGLSGMSKSGKTYISLKLMASAQAKGYTCVVLDSEGAITEKQLRYHGIDPSKVVFVPVGNVNKTAIILRTITDRIMEKAYEVETKKGPNFGKAMRTKEFENCKTFILLDSLGNLGCTSDSKAITNDSATMGSRAKEIRAVFRDVTDNMVKLGIPMVFTNHTFKDPSQTYTSKIQKDAGGGGPEYIATTLVQFRTSKLYEGSGKNAKEIGTIVKALCTKNREVPPLIDVEMELTPDGGLRKYSGMVDLGIQAGLMEVSGSYILCPDGKKRYRKDIMSKEEVGDLVFTREVLEKINEYAKENLRYSSVEDDNSESTGDDSEELAMLDENIDG